MTFTCRGPQIYAVLEKAESLKGWLSVLVYRSKWFPSGSVSLCFSIAGCLLRLVSDSRADWFSKQSQAGVRPSQWAVPVHHHNPGPGVALHGPRLTLLHCLLASSLFESYHYPDHYGCCHAPSTEGNRPSRLFNGSFLKFSLLFVITGDSKVISLHSFFKARQHILSINNGLSLRRLTISRGTNLSIRLFKIDTCLFMMQRAERTLVNTSSDRYSSLPWLLDSICVPICCGEFQFVWTLDQSESKSAFCKCPICMCSSYLHVLICSFWGFFVMFRGLNEGQYYLNTILHPICKNYHEFWSQL